MELPPEILKLGPQEAVRRIALALLRKARAAAARLDDEQDTEALHDFRVAIRRLRSTARQWRPELRGSIPRKKRRALRDLQSATGGGRDAEVALGWLALQEPTLPPAHRPGLVWLQARLEERRRAAMEHVREDLRERFARIEASLRERLPVMKVTVHLDRQASGPRFGPALARRARTAVRTLARRLGRIEGVEHDTRCHSARIACKRLRYLVEPARSVAEAEQIVTHCKRLQNVLGELNDAHVLSAELGMALEVAAAERARRLHELTRLDPAGYQAQRELGAVDRTQGLLELTRRVEQRARQLFGELERDWLSGGIETLLDDVEELAVRLEAEGAPDVEVERKYLLDALPDIAALRASGLGVEVLDVVQGWLPGRRLRERIRRTRRVSAPADAAVGAIGEVRYTRTIKLGAGLERTEIEETANESTFEALWPLTDGCRIRKRRYRIPVEGDDGAAGHVWEIDEFLDRPLVLAEVELADRDDAPETPSWLASCLVREVTDDPSFTNLKLAR